MYNLLSISEQEIQSAYTKGMMTLSNLVLENEYLTLYGIQKSTCTDVPQNLIKARCLYLYLYALNSWCYDDPNCNFLTEKELLAIMGKVEELQTICCKPI